MKLAILIFISILCSSYNFECESQVTSHEIILDGQKDAIPENARRLIKCYSTFIIGFSHNYLIFKDGSRLVWDDGIKNKSLKELMEKPDVEDMFRQKYVTGILKAPPSVNFDPGRIRDEQFFMKIYGLAKKKVEMNLTEIIWCPKLAGQRIKVTRINGIDKKLSEISKELDEHPEIKKYISNIGGTFDWRNINGTKRLSMHSFGMTIDINIRYSDYWQWECKCTDENASVKYKNRIPEIIVKIFEKNGFIWGGKWYHFDTMHFEYRPELIE